MLIMCVSRRTIGYIVAGTGVYYCSLALDVGGWVCFAGQHMEQYECMSESQQNTVGVACGARRTAEAKERNKSR